MTQEEAIMARDVRRHLEKRPLDITMAVINAHKGFVTISGQIKGLRSDPTADVKEELDTFHKQAMRHMRDVKSITLECRVIVNPKKVKAEEEGHEAGAPGAMEPAHGHVNPHHMPGQHH